MMMRRLQLEHMILLPWNIGALELSLIFQYDAATNASFCKMNLKATPYFQKIKIGNKHWTKETYFLPLYFFFHSSKYSLENIRPVELFWSNPSYCVKRVTDYSRDLEEMQNISREDYLAPLRRFVYFPITLSY